MKKIVLAVALLALAAGCSSTADNPAPTSTTSTTVECPVPYLPGKCPQAQPPTTSAFTVDPFKED